jgi:hypothetical protein
LPSRAANRLVQYAHFLIRPHPGGFFARILQIFARILSPDASFI